MALTSVARGRRAEDAASDYLRSYEWEIVAQNHRTPVGEIDLVCRDGCTLVFVEVKARSSSFFGEALEAVGPRKERRLRAAAAWWMAERGRATNEVRFDVVVVMLDVDGSLRSLAHLRDVLGPGR
ncbi:MAG: YraN family protein [Thermoleophilia bacterium]